jgi:quercetin dioxygenase-like cupin family protein
MTDSSATPIAQLIELKPPRTELEKEHVTPLIETNDFRVIRIVIPSGRNVPKHEAEGEAILQCLEGHVELRIRGGKLAMSAGQLVHLATSEPFSIYGVEDSSLLVTVTKPKEGPNVKVVGG